MNIIQTVLAESIIKNYTTCERTLQYTTQSTENKAERLVSTTHRLLNIL